MAWFKCGGGGIPAALKSLMNAVLNKKWGTSGTYPPETWPETVNLMGPLEEKTVSGSVVTFSDGADDVPIKSASFGIVASGGGGTPSAPVPIVGKSSVTVYHGKKNVFDITTYPITKKRYIRESDGYFAISTRDLRGATEDYVPCVSMRGKTWVINKPNQTGNTVGLSFYDENKAFLSSVLTYPSGTNGVFTVPNNAYYFRFSVDLLSEDDTEIQIEEGTTATAFSPFFSPVPVTVSLGQTVYGGTLSSDGTLTITHKVYETSQDDSNWLTGYYAFGYRYYKTAPQGAKVGGCKSDISVVGAGDLRFTIDGDNRLNAYCTSESGYDTLEKFKQALGTGIKILYELAMPIVITGIDEISISTYLGDNNIWCDSGDSEVVYRSSGTQTLIPPTLISKTITANGTYSASDEGADGYDEVTVNVSGGGGNTPQATQTLICDNSALGSSLTFTDDYENYDLIKFVVYRSDIGNQFIFYMTPAMINAMAQYSSNRINFNQPYGNNFVCYTKTSNTAWTRYGVRNLAVKYVYGLTFTNCTVTETELYNRQGIGSSNVTFTPPTGEIFFDYDYILLATCTGNSDETQANLEVFQPDIEKDIFGSDNADENSLRVYKYNQGGTFVTVTENTITAFSYFYACGLKLSYNQQNLLGGFNSNSEQGEQENEIENELNELEQEETPEEVDQNESNE